MQLQASFVAGGHVSQLPTVDLEINHATLNPKTCVAAASVAHRIGGSLLHGGGQQWLRDNGAMEQFIDNLTTLQP